MSRLSTELESALNAMETSFHVRLIATFDQDLVWVPADVEAAPWLAENHLDFDQFPVRHGDATIGVLQREGNHSGKSVRETMQRLREGLIVSADMPITDLILQLSDNHYRLVLRGGRIDGLVTQSDLLKLPVRMLLFGLISHLEICLRALIRERVPGQEWINSLKPDRRKAVSGELAKLRNAKLELDSLEFTNLSDVVDVLTHQPDFDADFETEVDAVRTLRNKVAHAKTYFSTASDVQQFANRFKNIHCWIGRISEMLEASR